MTMHRPFGALIGALLLLGGCAFVDEIVIPSITGEETTSAPPAEAQPPAGMAGLGDELVRLQSSAGTQDRALQALRAGAAQNAAGYHGTMAEIVDTLQAGAEPGDDALEGKWNEARAALGRMNGDLSEMTSLASQVAGNVPTARRLQAGVRGLQGTVAADEEPELRRLDDDVNATAARIDGLLSEIGQEVARQSGIVAAENNNLTSLSVAIATGQAYSPPLATQPQAAGAVRPFVVIRFDRANVEYKAALYEAVSKALERRPGAAFDVVAVAPAGGDRTEAVGHAEEVRQALAEMGLPPERLTVSAAESLAAAGSEVHLYLR